MVRAFHFAGAAVVVVVVIVVYRFTAYQPSEFRGAGPMRDDGFFSYYRYHAPLGEFPFDSEGSYQFSFSGLPSERMVLQFYVSGYSTKNREDIEALETVINVEIAAASGRVVCSANGSPVTPDPNKWVLMSNPFEVAYWHRNCADRPFERRTEYSLRVTVRALDPKTPKVILKAVLEGGGNELP